MLFYIYFAIALDQLTDLSALYEQRHKNHLFHLFIISHLVFGISFYSYYRKKSMDTSWMDGSYNTT